MDRSFHALVFFVWADRQNAINNATSHPWPSRLGETTGFLASGDRHHRDFNAAIHLTTGRRTVVRNRESFTHSKRNQTLVDHALT
jgi:hypothetical protein